jgi:hypothetical protein
VVARFRVVLKCNGSLAQDGFNEIEEWRKEYFPARVAGVIVYVNGVHDGGTDGSFYSVPGREIYDARCSEGGGDWCG